MFCWNELEIPEDGDDDGLKAVRRRKEKSWSVSRTNGIPPSIDRLSPHAFDYLTFKISNDNKGITGAYNNHINQHLQYFTRKLNYYDFGQSTGKL